MIDPGKIKEDYDSAVDLCDKITLRVTCINRSLEEDPLSSDGLTSEAQDRVATALSRHIANCEAE